MAQQTSPTLALLRQLEANDFLPAPSHASASHPQHHRSVSEGQGLAKRSGQRVSRACDACRRMKIKCVLDNNICEACALSARACTFEDSGTKRERPPTRKDISDLNARIESLEGVLSRIAPELDILALPRTADQARRIANVALSRFKPAPAISNVDGISTVPSHIYSKEDSLEEAVEALASLNFTSGRYLGSDGKLPFFNQHSFTQSASYDPDLDSMIDDPSRSLAERLIEKRHRSLCPSDVNLPPPDLAHSLISLYFSHVQPFTLILHQEHFLGLYGSGLIKKDLSFKSLCYAMFATAAHFSNDPRVLCPLPDEDPSQQTAGARYAAAAIMLISPVTLPCTLFDLQAMAVLSHFYLAMCTPTTAWLVIGFWLRRAQDVGVHVEDMPRWCTSLLKDQLRKRAFWFMVVSERVLCMALGRTSGILELELTVEPPLFIAEDVLTNLDLRYQGGITPQVRNEYNKISSQPTSDTYIACSTAYWGIRKLTAPYFYEIWSTDPEKIHKRPTGAWWGSSRIMLSDLVAKVNDYIENSIPTSAKWNPETADDTTLLWTAYLHCAILNIKLMAHRHLVNDAPKEIEICMLTARSLIDIMDHVQTRGLLEFTASWSPYKILPAGLICLYAACRREVEVQKSEKLTAWADVHRCINLFKAMAPRFFLAQQLQESLSWLVKVCIEDILTLKDTPETPNEKKRRRNVEEPLPSEVLLRNIFASNQRLASQRRNSQSYVPVESSIPKKYSNSSPRLSFDVPTVPVVQRPAGSSEFEKILDHLLSLPTEVDPQCNAKAPGSNIGPTYLSQPTTHLDLDRKMTSPTGGPENLHRFREDLATSPTFVSTSYLPMPTCDFYRTFPINSPQSIIDLSPENAFAAESSSTPEFTDAYVPPLYLDTSFFQLNLAPSFANVNLTRLPASSSPLRHASQFQDYVPYPPGFPQQTYIPPSSTPNNTTCTWAA